MSTFQGPSILQNLLGMTAGGDPTAIALMQAGQDMNQSQDEFTRFMQQRLSERNGANWQAQQAQQAYQREAQAPARGPGDIMQSMFANIGAGIARDPGISEGVRQQQAAERMARLTSLRDEYLQKAQIAQQMGQADVALENETMANKVVASIQQFNALRMKAVEHGGRLAELAKTLQGNKEIANIERDTRLAVEHVRGQEDRATARVKGELSPALRTAMERSGRDPETGLLRSDFVLSQTTKLATGIKRGDKGAAAVLFTIKQMVRQRLDTDASMVAMRDRLVDTPSPFDRPGDENRTYLLTGKRVYRKGKGGELELDPKHLEEAKAEAMKYATTGFLNATQSQ